MATCVSYALCEQIEINKLANHLSQKYNCQLFRDALSLENNNNVAIVFNYGIIVFWGHSKEERNDIINDAKSFMINLHMERESETLSYETQEQRSIKNDCIGLLDNTILEKLSFSHPIAQSLKLSIFEDEVQEVIGLTKEIPTRVAQTGKTKLSRKEIAKIRGELFIVKSGINLNFALLDRPEFYWEYPEFDNTYTMTASYLETETRIDVLNKKLEVVHELFAMLADEQSHKHSALLEWIIIILIALEIVLSIIKEM